MTDPIEQPSDRALKPCPKCGGDAQMRSSSDGEAEWFQCRRCRYESRCGLSYSEAIEFWNNPAAFERAITPPAAGDDALRAENERLREALESIEDLCSEEIRTRFGTSSSKSEAEVAGKSRIYSLLLVPRNIARSALAKAGS